MKKIENQIKNIDKIVITVYTVYKQLCMTYTVNLYEER